MSRRRPVCATCGKMLARGVTGKFCQVHRYDAARATARSPVDTLEIQGDNGIRTKDLPASIFKRVRTLADLCVACAIDQREWEIERHIVNKWEMGSVPVPGQPPVVTELYQVKAWMKRKTLVLQVRSEIDDLIAAAKRSVPARKASAPGKRDGVMLEINAPDLHIGKLAWSKETGYQDYDLTIAVAAYERAIEALLQRSSGLPIARILLPLGSDMFNTDNKIGTTTKGTPQDVDSRFQKSFVAGREMSCRVIDRLLEVAPVIVPVVPGNHDELTAWHLGHALECFYAKTKGVTIDNAPTLRKYHEWGRVMLCLTHGDKVKAEKMPLLMSTEQPAMWGRTTFREAHGGHWHQTKVQEWNGVRVRTFSSLCSADAWHAGAGHVGNLRSAEALAWDKTEGIVNTATFTLTE